MAKDPIKICVETATRQALTDEHERDMQKYTRLVSKNKQVLDSSIILEDGLREQLQKTTETFIEVVRKNNRLMKKMGFKPWHMATLRVGELSVFLINRYALQIQDLTELFGEKFFLIGEFIEKRTEFDIATFDYIYVVDIDKELQFLAKHGMTYNKNIIEIARPDFLKVLRNV